MNTNRNFAIVGGIVAVIIAIAVIGVVSEDENIVRNQNNEQQILTPEIQKKLDEKKSNEELELNTEYNSDRTREWLTSGPFQIDRSEYALGENIFFRANDMNPSDKGQIAFLRPLNSTHNSVYLTFSFDGSGPSFNRYFTPDLSKIQGICSIEDIVGEWTVVFRGTNYENLKFTISDSVFVPGEEERFEPVC